MAQANQPRRRVRRFAKVYHSWIDGLRSGDFTPAMLVVMNILMRWSNRDGEVQVCSASYFVTMTSNAYSERTFSEALHRLERMGYITRHMTFGSHQSYPVTIHNYEVMVTDEDGATTSTTINKKRTRTWREIKLGECDEGSDEISDETSDEGSDETSDKDRIESETGSPDGSELVSEREAEGGGGPQPPAPVNIDLPVWETWNESLEGQSPEQVRKVLLYHAKFNPRTYWRDRLTPRNIRSKFREMLNDYPCGWEPPVSPSNNTADDPATCRRCLGKGFVVMHDLENNENYHETCKCQIPVEDFRVEELE